MTEEEADALAADQGLATYDKPSPVADAFLEANSPRSPERRRPDANFETGAASGSADDSLQTVDMASPESAPAAGSYFANGWSQMRARARQSLKESGTQPLSVVLAQYSCRYSIPLVVV